MKPTFLISEAIKESWRVLKSQIWVLVGLCIGASIISFTLSFILSPSDPTSIGGNSIYILVSTAFGTLFSLGYIKNLFQAMDGEDPQFSAYGQESRKLIKAILAGLLYAIIVVIGIVLFIIPGIYLAMRLQFYIVFIVDEDAGIVDSLKRSWAITDKQVLDLLLVAVVVIAISIAGAMLLLIGLFIAIPLTYLMLLYIYRKLNVSTSAIEEPAVEAEAIVE